MITVSQFVEEYIQSHPYLTEALEANILNISALARTMRPLVEHKLEKRVDSLTIGMAIRRMGQAIKKKSRNSLRLVPDEIILRSGLTSYTFRKTDSLPQRISSFMIRIAKEKRYFSVVTEGVFESAIIFSKQYVSIADSLFGTEKKIATQHSLSAITLRLPDENVIMPGVYYQFLKKLAWEGINVVDIVSTNTEFTILIKDDDVEKTLAQLQR